MLFCTVVLKFGGVASIQYKAIGTIYTGLVYVLYTDVVYLQLSIKRSY